jgi:CheY-like chemotaxis protein
VAYDGKQAFEMFKQESGIKLIFMDISMPVMDGYEATQAIRDWETKIDKSMTYIIGVSGYSDAAHIKKCSLVGMNESITLPIS